MLFLTASLQLRSSPYIIFRSRPTKSDSTLEMRIQRLPVYRPEGYMTRSPDVGVVCVSRRSCPKQAKLSQKECTAEAAELANWLAANWWSGRINKDQPQLAQPGRPGLIANLFQRQPCQIEPLQSSVRVRCAIGCLGWLADGSRMARDGWGPARRLVYCSEAGLTLPGRRARVPGSSLSRVASFARARATVGRTLN